MKIYPKNHGLWFIFRHSQLCSRVLSILRFYLGLQWDKYKHYVKFKKDTVPHET